jgi:leucyl-tRNA synthetase
LTGVPNSEGDSVELSNETASVDAEPLEEKQMDKEVIQKINDEFGADVLAQTLLSDGDYDSAKALHAENEAVAQAEQLSNAIEAIEALTAERDELNDKLEALSQGEEEAVELGEAPVVVEDDKPIDILAEVKARTDEGMSAVDAQDAVRNEHPEAFKAFNKGE